MLEVVIPGTRQGEGKIMSSSAYRGYHCYISGFDSDGYTLLKLPYTSAQGAKAFYPLNKYYFEEDHSDTSDAVDKFKNGDTCIYYDGGEYITNKFDQTSFGLTAEHWSLVEDNVATAYGARMYNPGSSTAQGTQGQKKVYISYCTVIGHGVLCGDTAAGRSWAPINSDGTVNYYVGVMTGLYYGDSAEARLRYRIMPANQTIQSNY